MKKLTVGGIAVLVLAIGLSIAVAKGVFSSPTPETTAKTSGADQSAVTTTSSPLTFEGAGQAWKQ